jgi:enoyl-CoA hydratase
MTEVVVERRDGVGIITLDAPSRRNALTPEMARALAAACDDLDGDGSIGAVVVRGAGGAFCAGADRAALDAIGEDPAEGARYGDLDAIYNSFIRVSELRAPTVAAVRGAAVGAGLNLALVTDLRVVAEDAVLVAGFLRIGLHPGGGSLTLLSALAGREAAAAMAIFGESVTGSRAVELGLAWAAVPDAEVDSTALALAATAAGDPELSRLVTRSLRDESTARLPVRLALEYERGVQLWSLRRRHDRRS